MTRICQSKNNDSLNEDLQYVHGVKWTKTERYGAKLDATAQLVYSTGSNKNNVSPKEAVQDVHGQKWAKTERYGANLDATEQLFDSRLSNRKQ